MYVFLYVIYVYLYAVDISEVVERQTTFRLLALRAHRVADERTIEIVRVPVRLRVRV